jgi:hypothetical protein
MSGQPTMDTETRALSRNPRFQALIAAARASKALRGATTDEIDRELGITARDKAIAREYRLALERLEEEQGGEATAGQIRPIELELTAARYLRGEETLAALAAEMGLREDEIRAAAVGLTAVGLAVSAAG